MFVFTADNQACDGGLRSRCGGTTVRGGLSRWRQTGVLQPDSEGTREVLGIPETVQRATYVARGRGVHYQECCEVLDLRDFSCSQLGNL